MAPGAVSGGTMPLPRRRASQDMHVRLVDRECLSQAPSKCRSLPHGQKHGLSSGSIPSSSIGLHYICVAPIATSMSMASTSIPTSSARRLNPRVLSHGLARLIWTAQEVSASAEGSGLSYPRSKTPSFRKSTATRQPPTCARKLRDLSMCAIAITNRSDFQSQIPKSLKS